MTADLEELRRRLRHAAGSFRYALERREEGTVRSVGDGVARLLGMPGLRLDELAEIGSRGDATRGDGVDALALDLGEDDVGVVLLGPERRVQAGAPVRATGRVASAPVGDALLGRVIDPLGVPLDGLPPPDVLERWPLERPAPGIAAREAVTEPLATGVMVIDALFPIGRGQRQLLIGDMGAGKTTVATDAVIHQRDTGVRCVYVLIGQKTSAAVTLIETLRREKALAHTVVVVAGSDAPAGLRYLAPYAGCTIAEYFRDRGEDALVVFDDLSRHAVAYREIALLLGRPPGREAYPGDIFFLHARLLERATHLARSEGGGSLTALPVAETQAGRIADFIPTNLISITDGQLYFDRLLFDRGVKPAIDVGLSVSRVGTRTQRPSMKAVAGRLRLEATHAREVEGFARFGTRIEESTRQVIVRGERIREVLGQPPEAPIPMGEQVAVLAALSRGLFNPMPIERVGPVAMLLRARLRAEHPELLRSLGAGRPATEAESTLIEQALDEVA